jgi:chromosome partitioning protein
MSPRGAVVLNVSTLCKNTAATMTNTQARIITVGTPKGGAGKTTTCFNVAGGLAKRGGRVHLIDLDRSDSNTSGALSRWMTLDGASATGMTSATPSAEKLSEYLEDARGSGAYDWILIDVAGSLEQSLMTAMNDADLTIVPVMVGSEGDAHDAAKIIRAMSGLFRKHKAIFNYRVLLTRVPYIFGAPDKHVVAEVERLQLHRFASMMHDRPVYRESGFTGSPVHFADARREPISKACAELDSLLDEIENALGVRARHYEVA